MPNSYLIHMVSLALVCITVGPGLSIGVESSDSPAAVASEQQPVSLPLADGWLATYLAELKAPAKLQLPLAECWRFDLAGPSAIGPLPVAVSPKHVFLNYQQLPANTSMKDYMARRKASGAKGLGQLGILQCRDIRNGDILWSTNGVSGRFVYLPGYLIQLLLTDGTFELLVIDANNGNIVRRFPYTRRDQIAKIRALKKMPISFAEACAMDARKDLLESACTGVSPVPNDIAKWTADDAKLIFDLLSSKHLLRHGSADSFFVLPNPDNALVQVPANQLVYRSTVDDAVHWRTTCAYHTRQSMLWRPPYVAAFSSRTSVTAYRIEDGTPAWTYELPGYSPAGGPVYELASLADGILLITEPLNGLSEREYVTLSREEAQTLAKESKYLWLTKLDPEGKRLYQQELTMEPSYQKFAIFDGMLALWTENRLVCYGPTDQTPRTAPRDPRSSLDEGTRRQEIEKLHAEFESITGYDLVRWREICEELSRLKDRSMLDVIRTDPRVLSNKRIYADLLGRLGDRRAIELLIPMLKTEPPTVRFDVEMALKRLTGVADLSQAQWEPWWQTHKHLYKDDL